MADTDLPTPVKAAFKMLISVALAGLLLAAADNVLGPKGWNVAGLFASFEPMTGLAIPAVMLTIEGVAVGWPRSALRALLVVRRPSAMSDLGYLVLYIVGGTQVLAAAAAFGFVGWCERWANGPVGLLPLGTLSLWAQLPLLWLYMGFFGYW